MNNFLEEYMKHPETNRVSQSDCKDEPASREKTKNDPLRMEEMEENYWEWNIQSDRAFVSEHWRNLLDYDSSIIDRYSEELRRRLHPQDKNRILSYLRQCLAKAEVCFQCEYRVKGNLGDYIWVSSRGTIIWDNYGNALKIVGSHIDITGRK